MAAASASRFDQAQNLVKTNGLELASSFVGGYGFSLFAISLLNINPVVGGVMSVVTCLAYKVAQAFCKERKILGYRANFISTVPSLCYSFLIGSRLTQAFSVPLVCAIAGQRMFSYLIFFSIKSVQEYRNPNSQ